MSRSRPAPVTVVETHGSADGGEQGLASSVWTRDHARALRACGESGFGAVWVNTHGDLLSKMPHGGFKRSGSGKDLSAHSLEDYTRIKHVLSALGRSSTARRGGSDLGGPSGAQVRPGQLGDVAGHGVGVLVRVVQQPVGEGVRGTHGHPGE